MFYELPPEKGLMPISLYNAPKAAHILSAGAENQAKIVLMSSYCPCLVCDDRKHPGFRGVRGVKHPRRGLSRGWSLDIKSYDQI